MDRMVIQPSSSHFGRLSLVWVLGMALIGMITLLQLAGTPAAAQVHSPTISQAADGVSSVCVPTVFVYPLTIPLEIGDTFGPRLIRRYDFHRGIDWTDYTTAPVRAVTTGTVRSLRRNWTPDMGTGSGNFVHLTHEDIGCETRYSHLWAVHEAITNDLEVTPGQIIGWVGDTGATYPHLHFEVRQGMSVTQRAAIHPLSTPFLPWTNAVTPAVTLLGAYTNGDNLTALVEVTSPYTEPDVVAVSVAVSGAVTDSRTIDYADLNASTAVVAHLDAPYVNDVCIIPADLNEDNDYRVMMVFRGLDHGPVATVTAQAFDVNGWGSTDTAVPTKDLEVTPSELIARGIPSQTVSLIYTLTNRTRTMDTFTLTHLSAQGWEGTVTPTTATLEGGASMTASVKITLNTDTFGPLDCGLLKVVSENNPQQATAGSYRIYRDAYVSAETGSDGPNCGSMSAPCATIMYGLSRTDDGGTIHVAQGTYTENLTLTKTVDLLGGYTTDWSIRALEAYATTVDGGGYHTVLVVDGDHGPLIEGFTFTNGHRHDGAGGGVRFVGGAAPTLRSNWVLNNVADKSGGGIYIGSYGTLPPTIIDNVIASNVSSSTLGGGGGIYVAGRPVLIQGNVISSNQAISKAGGGLYLTGDTTAQVLGNRIVSNTAASSGGGVRIHGNAAPTLYDNEILNNTADLSGGGIYISGTGTLSPTIISNTISGNTSNSIDGGGGGIYITNRPALLQDNVIDGNQAMHNGGGIYLAQGSSAWVLNNHIQGNETGAYGGGIYARECPALIQGNVVGDNRATTSGGGIYLTADTTAQVLGNWIEHNEAVNDGGGVLVRSNGVCLVNNSIWKNTAFGDGNGIRVAGESTPCIYHNTLLANHPESGAGLYVGTSSAPTVANNIIANHAIGVQCDSWIPISCSVLRVRKRITSRTMV